MAKHKNKLIAAGIIIVILAALFWWGGNAPGLQGWSVGDKTQTGFSLNDRPSQLKNYRQVCRQTFGASLLSLWRSSRQQARRMRKNRR